MMSASYDPETDPLHPYLFADVADIPVDPVGPSAARVYNCLWNSDARYIGDVVVKSEEYWLAQNNFGKVALKSLKLGLAKIGLRLGIDLPDWPPTPERLREVRAECVNRRLWDFGGLEAQQVNADNFHFAETMDALRAVAREVTFLTDRLERLRNDVLAYRANRDALGGDQ